MMLTTAPGSEDERRGPACAEGDKSRVQVQISSSSLTAANVSTVSAPPTLSGSTSHLRQDVAAARRVLFDDVEENRAPVAQVTPLSSEKLPLPQLSGLNPVKARGTCFFSFLPLK